MIAISDNGMGIEPNNLKKIFKFGYTTKESGNGYGLHSCFNYMVEMGGSLEVNSQGIGYGATFIIKLKSVVEERSKVA